MAKKGPGRSCTATTESDNTWPTWFGGAKTGRSYTAFFWPKTLLSAEWEGYADHILKPEIWRCSFDVVLFLALCTVQGYDLPDFGQKSLFLQNGEDRQIISLNQADHILKPCRSYPYTMQIISLYHADHILNFHHLLWNKVQKGLQIISLNQTY